VRQVSAFNHYASIDGAGCTFAYQELAFFLLTHLNLWVSELIHSCRNSFVLSVRSFRFT
jgi:hypothetical protein